MPPLATLLFTDYIDFHRVYIRYLNFILAPYGLTGPHLAVLRRLHRHGALTLIDLAQRHGVEAPTMTVLVKKLSTTGLVTTETAEEDRRHKLVKLTDKGCSVFERARQTVDLFYAILLQDYSSLEIETVSRMFATMRQTLLSLSRGDHREAT